jgi:hypothetical protein
MRLTDPLLPSTLGGVILATLVAGCPNAGLAPPLPGDGAFTPAPALQPADVARPSASASATPALPASAAPSGGPTSLPVATATPAGRAVGATTLLAGTVYDDRGAAVEGARVVVRSLDAAVPFTATAATRVGSWVVNEVPVGVQLEVEATRAGWTRRNRVVALQAGTAVRNTLNFGAAPGVADAADPTGAAYFLSDHPEVVSAAPDAATVRGETLLYKLRLSEPLDAANRRRLENAFSLDTTPAPAELMPAGLSALQRASRIELKRGSAFRGGRATLGFTWNAAGDEVTVGLQAPLRRMDEERLAYRLQLVRTEGEDLIEDATGRVLGLVAPGVGEGYWAVRKGSLVTAAADTSATLRWQATHQRTATFEVERDAVAPTLAGVAVTTVTRAERGDAGYYRVQLTFSEPMRVFPDDRGYAASVVDPANYVLAFSSNKLDGVDLTRGTPLIWDTAARDAAAFATEIAAPKAAFRFAAPADPAVPRATDVFLAPSDDAAAAVDLFVPKAALPADVAHVRVLVRRAVQDPAGNGVSEARFERETALADNIREATF